MTGRAPLLCFGDEADFCRVPTLCAVWAPRGHQPRIPTDSKGMRQRATAFGLVAADGAFRCLARAARGNRDTFLAFLTAATAALETHLAPGQHVLLYVDNVRFHHCRDVLDPWLAAHPQAHLRYLPPYSPDLNPQEDEWRGIRARVTHDTLYPDLDQLWAAVLADARQRDAVCLTLSMDSR